jgi:AraC-like DNA-binding protein
LAKYGYKDRYVFFMDESVECPTDEKTRTYLIEAHGMLFCLAGRVRVLVEGSEYMLEPDDLLLLQDGEAHMTIVEGHPCQFIRTYFSPHYFYLFDPQYRLIKPFSDRPHGVNNFISGSALNASLIRECFLSILNVTDVYMRRIAVMGALTTALSEISHAYTCESIENADQRPELTRCIFNTINDHYTEHLDPDKIAADLFISRSQFDRIIKQATGITLWHYVTTKRLIRARHLMHEGVMIKEAASRSGFSDYSTFYKAYTKWNGTPPKSERPSEDSDPMLRNFYQLDETSQLL